MKSFLIFLFIYLCCLTTSISIDNSLSENAMYIRLGEAIFSINLYDIPLRKELLILFPIKTTPIEKDKFIYIPLSSEIEEESLMQEQNIIEAEEGDILLYQKKELIIINKRINFCNTNSEYIKIGKTENTNELYDSIKFNKPVYLWNSFNFKNYNEKIKPHEYYSIMMYFLTWKILTVICFLFL